MVQEIPPKKQEMKWGAVLWYIHLHVLGLYGLWLALTTAKWSTIFFTLFITLLGNLGVTAGAHRLWAHRSYKASEPLRLFLMLAHTLAGVGPIYDWVLYHRVHHKYHNTDKDPYNHKKGLLYSHYIGNFKTPPVDYEQAKIDIDMRDIDNDTFVWVQKKFYWVFFFVFTILLPLNAPLEYWNESMTVTLFVTGMLRLAISMNVSWLVNSALNIWSSLGNNAQPKIMIFFVTRSVWPNYHYMVPWDWKSDEFGSYNGGCSTFFIKMWKEMGLVTVMRTTESQDIRDMLHQIAKKKTDLKSGVEQLKDVSWRKAQIQELMCNS